MGILDTPGLQFLKDIDFSSIMQSLTNFIIFVFILLIIIGIFLVLKFRNDEKKKYNISIHLFEEINHEPSPIGDYLACVLTIPRTNVEVFYIKEIDLYLPKGVKRTGKNSYLYHITDNREMINFSLKSINKELREANLSYDYTDMRMANENLRELIQRNYRDKSIKWWKEYKDVIATVIFIFVLSIAFFFLLGKINEMVSTISQLLDKSGAILEKAETIIGSGIK